jgi:DNA polymerase-3 subunit alpha
MAGSFVHLHCHSHYSLLDGANRIPELVEQTKKLGMNALALTDHGNLYGAIEFYSECREAGINPVIGYEAYVAPGPRTARDTGGGEEHSYHLTLLAKNRTGFQNLIKMATVAFLEGYYYRPRIDKELLEAHKEGLVCLSGCASSEFSRAILKDQLDEARQLAEWFAKVFGKNFYIEIQNNGLDIQKRCAEAAIDLAQQLGLPLVATCDAHYLCQADADAHDVLLCINTGKTRQDQNRMRYGSNQFYVRPPQEMYKLFADQSAAVARSQEIADGCDIQLDFKTRHFPVFTPPSKKTPEDYLGELCQAGLKERYGAKPPKAVVERLEHELKIICRMGFASYFLIVWDFVRFAREQKIPASARGSACGALVSYVLQLSHVDPLEYDLLFERFLDPNRSEAPDIDIDFCQERREEVIAYVRKKYGEGSVAQIGTFGTMAARAAIKDVGRVLEVPLERVNQLTKLIPTTLNITIDEALQQNPDLKKEYDSDQTIHELIDIARKLEGTNRNSGTHAAGVVIANGPLTDYVPLQRVVRKGEDAGRNGDVAVTTQWVMGDLEKVGLLKMDFLGLRTLTLLDHAVKLIEKTRGQKIDLYELPHAGDKPEIKKTYELLQRGLAKGVFQLESEGIRELLKRMKPDNIRDIIAIMALYRPGPLQGGMVDAYVNRKHGREKPTYQHQVMEEILAETYGVLVYQEQCMRVLNRLGGIELASAYACVKAISKKKEDIIDQRRNEFIKGAQERGLAEAVAHDIFKLIVNFAGYGFNKSHTAAYAQVGYQTAYLKANYTAEFMAALLSSEIEDSNKRDIMVEHIRDARDLGIEVLSPDINAGDVEFTVQNGKILFGLTAIKGVGRGAAADIVRARQEKGPFQDIFDLCERIDIKVVPRPALEKLIKAGAMDCFGAHRRQLFEVLPAALQSAAESQQDRRRGQLSLFDSGAATSAEADGPTAVMPDIPEWPTSEKLKYEKEALDFYFSSHPLAQFEDDLRLSSHRLDQLANLGPNQEVMIGGMLTGIRYQNTKKARNGNTRYARCRFEDLTGSVECVMWPDDFLRAKDEFQEDRPCFVKGVVERTREQPGLVLTRVMSIDQAKKELARSARGLGIQILLTEHSPSVIDHVAVVLEQARGSCPVCLDIYDAQGNKARLRAGQEFAVNPTSVDIPRLESILGKGRVKLVW